MLCQRSWHVIAVDLPGHGETPANAARAPQEMAERLAGLLTRDPLDLLLGHSLGAVVALELLRMFPDSTRRLILDEPPGLQSVDWEGAASYLAAEQKLARRDPCGHAMQMHRELRSWHLTDCTIAVEDLAAHDRVALRHTMRAIAGGASHRIAPQIIAPTLVMAAPDSPGRYTFGGTYGSSIRGDERSGFLAAIPHAELAVFGRGHVLHRDTPGEWSARVDEFGQR